MSGGEVLGLLVATRDEPGVLYRISEAIFKHGANITYIAGGSSADSAELQLEVTGAGDQAMLIADLVGLQGITKGSRVPAFQVHYGQAGLGIGRRGPGRLGGEGARLP